MTGSVSPCQGSYELLIDCKNFIFSLTRFTACKYLILKLAGAKTQKLNIKKCVNMVLAPPQTLNIRDSVTPILDPQVHKTNFRKWYTSQINILRKKTILQNSTLCKSAYFGNRVFFQRISKFIQGMFFKKYVNL